MKGQVYSMFYSKINVSLSLKSYTHLLGLMIDSLEKVCTAAVTMVMVTGKNKGGYLTKITKSLLCYDGNYEKT